MLSALNYKYRNDGQQKPGPPICSETMTLQQSHLLQLHKSITITLNVLLKQCVTMLVFSERDEVISAGNFHGEYPAKVLDYLGIAVNELANISERRIDRMINPGE
ncbi:hypothetical protein AHF37_00116 [Paragonimus kellicotti]|nr:hypothetical protein AHF37_00116 [Paragonimus kellicotti]